MERGIGGSGEEEEREKMEEEEEEEGKGREEKGRRIMHKRSRVKVALVGREGSFIR